MFGFFLQKKTVPAANKVQQRIADTIVRKSIRFQERWAVFLQRKSEKLSTRSKKYGIILFCLVAGGYSCYTAIASLSSKKIKSIVIIRIHTPKYLTQTGEENIRAFTTITESEFRKIKNFRVYMDSLNKTTNGRRKTDSILLKRPGLMDSIIQLEQLYHFQQSPEK